MRRCREEKFLSPEYTQENNKHSALDSMEVVTSVEIFADFERVAYDTCIGKLVSRRKIQSGFTRGNNKKSRRDVIEAVTRVDSELCGFPYIYYKNTELVGEKSLQNS